MRPFLLLVLSMLIAASTLQMPSQPVAAGASAWPGWSALTTVVMLPADGAYLSEAAREFAEHVDEVSPRAWTFSDSEVEGPAIRLKVDPDEPRLAGRHEEAVWLYTDDDGIHIVGGSPLAVRHGVYIVLEELGFRWFFKHPAWSVAPDTLHALERLDEVHEPAFDFRLIWHNSIDDGGWGKEGLYTLWRQRNRLDGARNYEVSHSYDQILRPADTAAPDSAFCPSRDAVWPRQLDPRDPYVIAKASEYGIDRLGRDAAPTAHFDEALPFATVSVTPNDGRGWCTDLALDPRGLTDAVFGLANSVARDVAAAYPDRYVGVYSYNEYDFVPRLPLERNLLVQVSTYSRHNLPLDDRLQGFRDADVLLGVYDYLDVPQWSLDRPPTDFQQLLDRIPYYRNSGVRVFEAEASDGWGARGLLYYLAGRLLWDPDADIDLLMEDFYEKAFGHAAPAAGRYYERLLSGVPTTDRVLALSFADLAEAEEMAASRPDVLERVRHLEYYTRYLWLRTLKDRRELDIDGMKQLYSLVNRLRSLYIVDFKTQVATIGASLSQAGVSPEDIRALEVIEPPSESEAEAWMREAEARFGAGDAVTATYVEILGGKFVALGDPGLPAFWPLVAVRENSNEKRVLVVSEGASTGVLRPFSQGTSGAAAAGVLVGPNEPGWFDSRAVAYFFVPASTKAFVLGVEPVLGSRPWTSLVDPRGRLVKAAHCDAPKGGVCEYAVNNPAPGIWRLDYDFRGRGADVYLLGVPPLIWHDPSRLAVPYDAASSTPLQRPGCCEERRWE